MSYRMGMSVNHEQEVASNRWEITHNLGRTVACDVHIDIDGLRQKVLPHRVYNQDDNTLIIEFTVPVTGGARLF